MTRSLLYAGIGSRETPADVLDLMSSVAERLARMGWTLRSGGAAGADSAFERGHRTVTDQRLQVFLATGSIGPWAFELAERLHPAWERCSPYARKLHARNGQIVLGAGGGEPVRFVLCWTEGGTGRGGTGQGMRVARDAGIPVFDLALPAVRERLSQFVTQEVSA